MKKPVKICFAVIVFLAILTGSVVLVLNLRPLYRLDISRFGLEEVSGLSADRIKANYDVLIDYNLLWHREPLVFPDLPMSETARIHFEEVKRIFDLFQAVFLAAGAASLVILIRQRGRNRSWLKITGILAIVFPVLDVLQHPLKLQTALDVLSGKAFIGILPGDCIALIFRIFPKLILLGLQTVAVDLDRCGNTGVNIALLYFLDHFHSVSDLPPGSSGKCSVLI